MDTGINNGKLHTNNISGFKLLLFSLLIIISPALSSAMEEDKKWVIVIDAGHGGRDPGALGSFSKEKDITLPIALKTGDYITKNLSNVKVLYTRESDVFVDIRDRAEFANRNKADLFVSIHVNWAKYRSIKGTETFVMGLAKDQENLEVAMKENEVILLEDDYTTKYEGFDPKSPESYIMFTLIQNIHLSQSTNLASKMQSQYKDRVSRTDRGVKQAGFWVLFMTTMPSVLTEIGFITNADEEKFLNSTQGKDYIASAIFRACRDYINEMSKKSGISAVRSQDSITPDKNQSVMTGNNGEISFRIQIATSSESKELKSGNFKGLKDVTKIKTDDRYRYVTGNFGDYSEAVEYRKSIEDIYPDAFVIAVKDNKILPLREALEQKRKN